MNDRDISPIDVGTPGGSPLKSLALAFAGVPPLGLKSREPMLLMPVNLRVDHNVADHFRWDRIDGRVTEIQQAQAEDCLWDFVGVADAVKSGNGISSLFRFFNKWGVLDEGFSIDDWGGYAFVSSMFAKAVQVKAIIETLVACEWDELISDETGADLYGMDNYLFNDQPKDTIRSIYPVEFRHILQRSLVDSTISEWFRHIDIYPSWSTGRRQVSFAPRGAKQIIGYGLLGLYTAADIDVYTCSVCGRMYKFNPAEGRRRPRAGARRYCGEDCTKIGIRESKRSSYHRRKK